MHRDGRPGGVTAAWDHLASLEPFLVEFAVPTRIK